MGRSVSVDNPITDPRDDVLGRREAAESFAQSILRLDASEGAVVGVFGPWGSGKTSFLNLVKHELEGASIHILDFNPWMFSGTEQLVGRFFTELSSRIKELKLKNPNIGRGIKEIGDALRATADPIGKLVVVLVGLLAGLTGYPAGKLFGPDGVGIAALVGPLVGGAIGVAATTLKIAGTSVRRRDVGIEQIRKKVEDALGKCEKPIVVILDDVDRLTSNEIAELFRLVRLVARFPNVIYVIACDRDQVTSVLDHQGGARYLEKIIQIPFNLPEVSRHKLEGQVRVRIDESLGPRGSGLDDDAIPSIVDDIVLPLIRNMRNVNQYISIVLGTVIALKTKVAPADVLGLEAIRVFLPQVFERLPFAIDSLTFPPMMDAITEEGYIDMLRTRGSNSPDIEDLAVDLSEQEKKVVEAMCRHLFPATNRTVFHYGEPAEKALQSSRVACRAIMWAYLEHVSGEELLALADAERVLKCIDDPAAVAAIIGDILPSRRKFVVAHVSGFPLERFRIHQVAPGVVGLWALLEDGGLKSLDYESLQRAVRKATRHLFRVLKSDTAGRDAAARQIFSKVRSLGSRVELVKIIGGDEQEFRIVSDPVIEVLKETLLTEIRSASVERLVAERGILPILEYARDTVDATDSFVIRRDPKLTFLVIYQCEQAWERLEHVYGGATVLARKIEDLLQHRSKLAPWIRARNIQRDHADRVFDDARTWLNGYARRGMR